MTGAAPSRRVLGVFALAMINVAAIISLRNLPMMAEYGMASITFYILAALLYFIPTGLVCAELATAWPKEGGVYTWIKEAFGPNWAFLGIWWSWMESISWFPTILSFVAVNFAYLIDPALAFNQYFNLALMLTIFWSATLANLFGMRVSSWLTSLGVLFGTLIPGLIVIGLGIAWTASGRAIAMPTAPENLIPVFDVHHWVLLSGVLLGLTGLELAAFHARDTKNPQRDYPKAILLSALLIMTLSILGTLAIAAVLPAESISLVAGVMQAFEGFLDAFGMHHYIPAVAILLIIGPFAGIMTWIIGPVKGVLPAAEAGYMPEIFRKKSSKGVPYALLFTQAIIVSLLALCFLWLPNIDAAYWVLTDWAAQFSLVLYVLMFAAAIRLRFTQPDVERPYRVPGGNLGMCLVAGVAIVTCFSTFVISFLPPVQLDVGNTRLFMTILIGGFTLLSMPALLGMLYRMVYGKFSRSARS